MSYRIPKKLREPLHGGSDEIRENWVLKFRSRDPDSYSLWVPPLEYVDDEVNKGSVEKHRLRACRHIARCLGKDCWVPMWPKCDEVFQQCQRVFSEIEPAADKGAIDAACDELKRDHIIRCDHAGFKDMGNKVPGKKKRWCLHHFGFERQLRIYLEKEAGCVEKAMIRTMEVP